MLLESILPVEEGRGGKRREEKRRLLEHSTPAPGIGPGTGPGAA